MPHICSFHQRTRLTTLVRKKPANAMRGSSGPMSHRLRHLEGCRLLKPQCSEELRTMEVRFVQTDGIPRKEMGRFQLVAALVEVGADGLVVQRSDVVQEEGGIGYHQSHFPAALSHPFVKVFTSQRGPAQHLVEHLLRAGLRSVRSFPAPMSRRPAQLHSIL